MVNNAELGFSASTANMTFTGVISGTGLVAKRRKLHLTLSGSTGNTYEGTTTSPRKG